MAGTLSLCCAPRRNVSASACVKHQHTHKHPSSNLFWRFAPITVITRVVPGAGDTGSLGRERGQVGREDVQRGPIDSRQMRQVLLLIPSTLFSLHDVRECQDGQSGTQVDVVGTLQVLSFWMHCSVRIQNDIVHVKRSRGFLSCSRFGLVFGLVSCLSRSEPDTGTVYTCR